MSLFYRERDYQKGLMGYTTEKLPLNWRSCSKDLFKLPSKLMIYIIKFYKKWLSPMKRTPTCRFYPTCSTYALKAYERHGFFLGTVLSIWRIIRCNPFCKGGYDPVPTNIRIKRGGKIDEIK